MLFFFTSNGVAATKKSKSNGGVWSVGSTWIGNVAPVAGDDIIIDGPVVITLNTVVLSSVQVTSNGVLSVSANGVSLNVSGSITNAGNIKFWDSNVSGVYGRITISTGAVCNLSGTGAWNLGTITIGSGSELKFDNNMTINIANTITWTDATSKFNKTTPVSNTTLVFNGVAASMVESSSAKAVYPNITVNKTGAFGLTFNDSAGANTINILGNINITNAANFITVGDNNTLNVLNNVSGLGYFNGSGTASGLTTLKVSGAGSILNLRLTNVANSFNDLIIDRPNGVNLFCSTPGGNIAFKNSIQLNNNSSLTLGNGTTDNIGILTIGTATNATGGIISGNGTLACSATSTSLYLYGTGAAIINFNPAAKALANFTADKGTGGTVTINNGPAVAATGVFKVMSSSKVILGNDFTINSTIDFLSPTARIDINGHTLTFKGKMVRSGWDDVNAGRFIGSATSNIIFGGAPMTATNDFLVIYFDQTNSSTQTIQNFSIERTNNIVEYVHVATNLNIVGNLNITQSNNAFRVYLSTITLNGTFSGNGTVGGRTPNDQCNLIINGSGTFNPTAGNNKLPISTVSGVNNFYNVTINRVGSVIELVNSVNISNQLTVSPGSLLTLPDNARLTLGGAITTSAMGYLSTNTNSELYITGSGINTSYSLFFNPNNNTLKTLNISRTGTGTIIIGNALNVTDNLDISGTTSKLNANGFLTLVSTSSKTANVGPIASTASIAGNVTAQRFVTGGSSNPYRSFRMFSSPVNDASGVTTWSAAQLKNNIFITGPGGSANGFDVSSNSQPSAFTYNEPAKTAAGFDYVSIPQVNANVTSASIGQGLMVFYRGDRSNSSVMSNNTINPANTTISFVGALNQQSITRPLSYTNNGESTDGFNLLGNPYQCTIDWNATSGWTKTNISNTIYIYNPAQRTYATYNGSVGVNGGSRYIYPGEGFFVQATGPGASVTFTENIKTSTVQPTIPNGSAPLLLYAPVFAQDKTLKLMGASPAVQTTKPSNIMQAPSDNSTSLITNNIIRVRLVKDDFYDETVVLFNDIESNNYTGNDAPRLEGGGNVSLASQSADQRVLAINYMSGIENVSSVKLNVGAVASGNYILKFTDIDLPAGYRTQLKDNYLNTITDINSDSQYAFGIDKAIVTSYGSSRFEILINTPTTLSVDLMAFTGKATTQGAMLNWKTSSEKDNDLFEVERSLDGQIFVKIGSVKSKASNSATSNNYEFLDTKPALGINYYRLKQIDLDGTPTIIDPIALNFNGLVLNNVKLTLYPNPTVDKITVVFAGLSVKNGCITVVDALGKKLISKNVGGDGNETQLSLDVNNLNPGVYFVEIYDGNKLLSKGNKFIKQ